MGTATPAFIVIGGVGLAVLVISLLFGEFGHGEADFGHAEVDVSGPDTEVGHPDANTSSDPSMLSPRILAAGLFGFGAFGACASYYGLTWTLAALIALFGFFVVALGVFFLIVRPLAKQEGNTLIGRQTYVGREARVILPIGPNRVGQVEFIDANGGIVHEMARSYGVDTVIPNGTVVFIIGAEPDSVRVSPLQLTDGNGAQA